MKRILVVLGLFALTVSRSFASDPSVSSLVVKSFQARFSNATDISWSEADGFAIAAFTQEGKRKYAYFNQSAELVVVAEPIHVSQLSEEQQNQLKEKFSGFSVTEAYKMKNDEGVRYYVVLENHKSRLILNSSFEGWTVVKKAKK